MTKTHAASVTIGLEITCAVPSGALVDLQRFETCTLPRVPCIGEHIVDPQGDGVALLQVTHVEHLVAPDDQGQQARVYCNEVPVPRMAPAR